MEHPLTTLSSLRDHYTSPKSFSAPTTPIYFRLLPRKPLASVLPTTLPLYLPLRTQRQIRVSPEEEEEEEEEEQSETASWNRGCCSSAEALHCHHCPKCPGRGSRGERCRKCSCCLYPRVKQTQLEAMSAVQIEKRRRGFRIVRRRDGRGIT